MTLDAIVVGAGVTGLTTALRLTRAGLQVGVRAAETGAATTSYAAGAMVSPAFGSTDPRMNGWAKATVARMTELASNPATGVHLETALLASRHPLPPPDEAAELNWLHICGPDELPAGFAMGMRTRLPFVAMPTYLAWLTDQLAEAGVDVELGAVHDLAEPGRKAGVVVNCTGVGARALAGDDTTEPDRGQHVVVANPGVTECFYEVAFERTWAGWMVHGDVVVLGGVSGGADWSREPDLALSAAIVERGAAIEPLFRDAEVLEHRVGLRPARPSVRLEAEVRDGARVVHSYGHGGMGVALSWGCADDVVALVAR